MTTTLTLSLPENLRVFVEEQTAKEGRASPEEYIQGLIDAELRRAAKRQLEGEILQGLQSGEPNPLTPEDWASIRAEGRRRLGVSPGP